MFTERLQVLMSKEQRRRLEAEAKRRHSSVGALIREAIDGRAAGGKSDDYAYRPRRKGLRPRKGGCKREQYGSGGSLQKSAAQRAHAHSLLLLANKPHVPGVSPSSATHDAACT